VPNYYNATFIAYSIRNIEADANRQYNKDAYQDIDITWELDVVDENDKPITRHSWPKIPKGTHPKAELVIMLVAIGAATEEELIKNGIPNLIQLLDKVLGWKCRLNVIEHKKKDGTLSDKIDSYQPLIVGRASAGRATAPTTSPAQPRAASRPTAPVLDEAPFFNEEESDIPF
jgi:hypothetical protein